MIPTFPKDDPAWITLVREALAATGCAVVTGVLSADVIARASRALYRLRDEIDREVGATKLEAARELGTLRLPFASDPVFYDFLALPEVLAVVDAILGETAIVHLMNGFILPSMALTSTPALFQNSFHRDFPRYLNGYVASINTFFAIDTFTRENGATIVAPGTHQSAENPSAEYLERQATPVEAPAGAMLVFDSTLWHCAGRNTSGADRLALNVQFTRSYIKQQFDYVRALGPEAILAQPSRTQQLLGWYTRVVTSLDEYYRPESERLYQKGQG